MATKPTNTYRWAQESGGTKHNIEEPSSGRKDIGWLPGQGAINKFFNWLGNGAHEWILYLKDAVFVGEAGQPGVTATGGTGNTAGGVLTGVGTGNGATITGGATGKGAVVTAGGGNTIGLEATGAGTGSGVQGTAPGGGSGVVGIGINGRGVFGQDTGGGIGGDFTTAASTGYGLQCAGNSTRAPFRIVPQSAQPSSAAAGDIYYDSDDNKLYLYDGTTWVVVGSQA